MRELVRAEGIVSVSRWGDAKVWREIGACCSLQGNTHENSTQVWAVFTAPRPIVANWPRSSMNNSSLGVNPCHEFGAIKSLSHCCYPILGEKSGNHFSVHANHSTTFD